MSQVPLDSTFLKGIGISVWQNSPDMDASNWTEFARKKKYFGQQQYLDAFLKSNDFWNMYETDLALASSLGATSFRFSFEWARLQPRPGFIDPSAVARYHAMLDAMARLGLEPCATLHHFTHPQWFEQAGGFVDPANNATFVNYCKTVFAEFGSRIRLWATFNEPTCFSFVGYIAGLWCPGQTGGMVRCGRVLLNLLTCHVEAYQALKAMPGGREAQVGIVHQHIRFLPASKGLAKLWTSPLCHWMTYWFGTSVLTDFFTTGRFTWRAPLLGTVITAQDDRAPRSFDWWGVNYYTRVGLNWRFQRVGLHPGEPLTDMHMPMCASDLGHHLRQAAACGRPLYVTETGIADREDKHRARLIDEYYGQVGGWGVAVAGGWL